MTVDEEIDDDDDECDGFGYRHGKPQPSFPYEQRQGYEHGYEYYEAAQQHEGNGGTRLLYALQKTDEHEVEGEAYKTEREEGESANGYVEGIGAAVEEETHEPIAQEDTDKGNEHTAHEAHGDGELEGGFDALSVMLAVVVAHNGELTLGNGVAKHEDEGEQIATHTEGCHAVFVKKHHEHIVAHHYHAADCSVGDECREAHLGHIADVANGEAHTGARELEAVEMEGLAEPQHIHHGHHGPEHHRQGGGYGCALDAHVERKDKEPVEEDVDEGGYDITEHTVFRGTIKTDDKRAGDADEIEHGHDTYIAQVVDNIWLEYRRTAENVVEVASKDHSNHGHHSHKQGWHGEGLGDIDVGGLEIAMREVYGSDHRHTGGKHEGCGRHDEINWGGDVDGSEGIAAHTLAHEYAVGNIEDTAENKSHERRDE